MVPALAHGFAPLAVDEPPGEVEAHHPAEDRTRSGFRTERGAWFYLLNLLGPQHGGEGWGDLLALGLALGLEADEPLRDFFTQETGEAWDVLTSRERSEDLKDRLALAWKRYGPGLEALPSFHHPARVCRTRCHLDVHFPLEAVQLAIRRVGLDLNPGWLPWLGCTVTFHYGSPEASA